MVLVIPLASSQTTSNTGEEYEDYKEQFYLQYKEIEFFVLYDP